MRRWSSLVAIVLLHAGCGDGEPPTCDPAHARAACVERGDPWSCGWTRILGDDASLSALRAALDVPTADVDAALRAALPVLADRPLADDVTPAPASITFAYKQFAPYELTAPIDWAADPYGDPTWRLELQSLSWIAQQDLDSAATALRDWDERAMALDPPLEWAWDEAAMAKRLNAAGDFLVDYVAHHDVLDRAVVRAVARIVVTHLYALSTDACYAAKDNHGMMEDAAVLRHVRDVPHLADGGAVWDHALERAVAHVARSVTDDGIHVEHSPDYQVLYLGLVLDVLDAVAAAGEPPPPALVAARDGLFAGITYLLEPNLTLVQFGDTENKPARTLLGELTRQARAEGGGDPTVLDRLDWVLTAGATGSPPTDLDRVWAHGGYAAFRERWDAVDPASPIAGYFACHHFSSAHAHEDETSFELYGYGTELVVDSGKYSYDRADPYDVYQRDVVAHNVVVVDGAGYRANTDARIVDHGESPAARWVQGTHTGYERLGVALVRTFAYAAPDTFVVIDRVRATGVHDYDQHLHLVPALDQVVVVDARSVIATSSTGGPSVTITAPAAPDSIELVRGRTDGGLQGWYFPSWQQAVAATDVILHHRRDGGSFDLPFLVTIAAPGAPPAVPTGAVLDARGGVTSLSWTAGGRARTVAVPTPDP